jgi:exosortase K
MTTLVKISSSLKKNGIFYILGLLAALSLKYHYSTAGAEDLAWMLAPVAHLVGLVGGITFEWEQSAGFVNYSHAVIIAPACAGINFLIICFCSLYFSFVSRLARPAAKCAWLGASLAFSYLVALCTNTIRILISIYLYETPIYGGWITPERVHRLAGILIYIFALVAIFLAAEGLMRHMTRTGQIPLNMKKRRTDQVTAPCLTLTRPLTWYMLITLCVPLLNGAFRGNGVEFMEHSLLVASATLIVFTISFSIMAILQKRVDISKQTKEKGADR